MSLADFILEFFIKNSIKSGSAIGFHPVSQKIRSARLAAPALRAVLARLRSARRVPIYIAFKNIEHLTFIIYIQHFYYLIAYLFGDVSAYQGWPLLLGRG